MRKCNLRLCSGSPTSFQFCGTPPIRRSTTSVSTCEVEAKELQLAPARTSRPERIEYFIAANGRVVIGEELVRRGQARRLSQAVDFLTTVRQNAGAREVQWSGHGSHDIDAQRPEVSIRLSKPSGPVATRPSTAKSVFNARQDAGARVAAWLQVRHVCRAT
jgi:hypothetical protein